jgi:hypothetical protein
MHTCPCPNPRQLSRICREFLSITDADLGINDDPLLPRFANWQQLNYASGSDKKAAISGSSSPKNRVSRSRANCQNSSSPSQSTCSNVVVICSSQPVYLIVSLSVTRLPVLSHPSRRSSSRKGHGLSFSHGSTRHVALRRLHNAKLAYTSCTLCWKLSSKGSRIPLKTSSNSSRFSLPIPKA